MLQHLNHHSIPRYLNSFETRAGFCLVQEYKAASSLAQQYHWTSAEIKQIAVAILQVLAYLQQQVPPVIHRDIKPENILVDPQGELKVYLVDFGFAHMGGKEVAVSSVVKGTLGFMPPEQLFNRQLTLASDLYSLGATLICLLTKTKSTQIGDLIDEAYGINFKHLVPGLSPRFIDWLQKMVAPSLKNRYPNATAALQTLQPIAVVGQAPKLRKLVCATKLRMRVTAVRLATIGFVAGMGTTVIISFHPDPIKQLLVTHQCPSCNLSGAHLEGTYLYIANLRQADLRDADFRRAGLEGAHLESTDLGGANLREAHLAGAHLKNADHKNADLREAALREANLSNADLEGANIKNADLRDAKLGGARMPDGSIHL